MKKYTVKAGDTLTKIANDNGVTLQALKNANTSIKDINKISIGIVLNIPTVEVKKDYDAVGRQVEKCLKDIEQLPSVKTLQSML